MAGDDTQVTNGGDMAPVLFTIGYEDHSVPESLVKALVAADVEVLVDVRDLPLSRRRGFSKTALGEALRDAGLEYRHIRALGNPKPLRDLYRNGQQAKGERLYRAHLRNGSSGAVDELAELIPTEAVCVLCFEADHRSCHRAVIVEELEKRLPELEARHL
ncbi:MAG: hypothetical protein QOI10_1791 [Solirubrobacterales bacterium]|jgi:uncharacterized protein (DUF488 family)|nr:hypothetical protein [Solirubrobacterales bacterium]